MKRVDRGTRLVALLYLLLALPCALRLAFVTVPYDTADEVNHFLRATQIGQGGLLSTKLAGGNAGGALPVGVVRSYDLDHLVHGPGHDRITRTALAPFKAIHWGRATGLIGFPNTATYGPAMYAPAALGIDLGRLAGLPVLATLRAARAADAVAATSLAATAILITVAGLPFLSLVLMLPMTLSLFGSASQDAMLIASGAFVAAWLGRRGSGATAGWFAWLAIGALVGAMAMARPPYALLAAIFVILTFGEADRAKGLAAAALTMLIAGGWFVFGVATLGVPTRAGGSLLGGAQIHWIMSHEVQAALVVWRTLVDWPDYRFREVVGVLGWLDIALPERIYRWTAIAMIGTLAMTLWRPGTGAARRLLILLTLVATVLSIYVALYLSWTMIGAVRIDGVQGRYFIPLAPFLLLLGRSRPGAGHAVAAAIVIVAMAAVEQHVVFPAVAAHLIR